GRSRRRYRGADSDSLSGLLKREGASPGGAGGCSGISSMLRSGAPQIPVDDAHASRARVRRRSIARGPSARRREVAGRSPGCWAASPPLTSPDGAMRAAGRANRTRFTTSLLVQEERPGAGRGAGSRPRAASPGVRREFIDWLEFGHAAFCTCPARRCPPAWPFGCDGTRSAGMTRVAVLGAGSWGSTFALVLADAGCDVTLWARREETVRAIRETHRNPEYLGEVELPAAVTATTEVAQALEGADGVVLALPTQRLRENLSDWHRAGIELPPVPVLSLAKGIERGTDQRMSQVIAEAGGVDPARIAVLSGPNLALEIAARQPSGSVIAAA